MRSLCTERPNFGTRGRICVHPRADSFSFGPLRISDEPLILEEKIFTVAPMMDFCDRPFFSTAYDAPCAECVQKERS